MNYTPEDYVEFYNDRVRTTNARHGWLFVGVLLLIVACTALLNGCDAQDAANTAVDEQEAHQRHVDILLAAGWVKFQPTVTPMRASDLDLTVTACQQIQDRQWECFAK